MLGGDFIHTAAIEVKIESQSRKTVHGISRVHTFHRWYQQGRRAPSRRAVCPLALGRLGPRRVAARPGIAERSNVTLQHSPVRDRKVQLTLE